MQVRRLLYCLIALFMFHCLPAFGTESLASIRQRADRAMSQGPWSVLDKTTTAPSGNKRDFLSHRPYWWPNPPTPDGFYVNRDGEVNPVARSPAFDREHFFAMVRAVELLSQAFVLTKNGRSALLIRTWFLDDHIGMTPNLNYAQWRPGDEKGRKIGIIRGVEFLTICESIQRIATHRSWTAEDDRAWARWLSSYAHWLATSELGLAEGAAKNNHGTWYDVQLVSFARYGEDVDLAKSVIHKLSVRIDEQIMASGEMPLETKRTKSWDYSVMNLEAFVRLAEHARTLKMPRSVWDQGKHAGIQQAIAYLLPYARGEKKWPHKQITPFKPKRLVPVLERAAWVFDLPSLSKDIDFINDNSYFSSGRRKL